MQDQIEQINLSIDQARESVMRRDALDRLRNTPDFKLIVEEGYFINEASRLVSLKADPEMAPEAHQKQIDNAIMGVSALRLYFRTIYQLGNMSEKSIKDDEATRDELLAEEV